MHPWIRRARHDLIKRAVWVARDLRELSQPAQPADLRALRSGLSGLIDEEGRPVDARTLWARLCEDAPAGVGPLLPAVGQAIDAALEAVAHAERDGAGLPAAVLAVLRIETAFDALARSMNLQN